MIEHHLRQFLKKFYREGPLLLALSGGPDSMSLFHLLLAEGIPLSVVHVDHGWRASSQQEAERLRLLCAEHDVPFYLRKISIQGPNLEDRCREARLAIFKELAAEVVLGHQAGDLAETVLKRLFEGARLSKLAGMKPVVEREGLMLLRPLLSVPKREILNWLHERNLWYFEDETNHDPRFLRSRLRHTLLPLLEKSFGKHIETSLVRIAEASSELETHVAELLARFPIEVSSDGWTLDLSKQTPASDFEWKMVISNFFEKTGEMVSAGVIKQVIDHLKRRSGDKSLRLKNSYVKLNRRLLCLQPRASRVRI